MSYITGVSMLAVSAGALAAFAVALLYWLRHRDDLREITAERDKWRRLETEAAKYVEVPIVMRTDFSGEPPYVGWEGLGLALNEALDERDALRTRVAELEGTDGKLRVSHSLIQSASIRTAKVGLDATLTDSQISSACLFFQHDYGLLRRVEQRALRWQCVQWNNAIRKAQEASK